MSDRETEAEQRARETVDRIVGKMCSAGFDVEMTHKSGHKANHVPISQMGGWADNFETNLAWVLVGAWSSKWALVHLLAVAREDAATPPTTPKP
jgi:hypothetical protein